MAGSIQRIEALLLAVFVSSCEGGQPPLILESVVPNLASSDRDTNLSVSGSFYAPVGADLGAGQQYLRDDFAVELGGVSLFDVALLSDSELTALLPSGFLEGEYDLVVHDPLGRQAEIERAVLILPPDDAEPVVTILSPDEGSQVEAGHWVVVSYSVADGPPGRITAVSWAATGAVSVEGEPEIATPIPGFTTALEFEVPGEPGSREITVLIMALDDAPSPNQGRAVLHLEVNFCNGVLDCDDGNFCNGIEACVEHVCVAGEPIDCSDGVDCTVDFCYEPIRRCYNDPNDEACDNGDFCDGEEICLPEVGCVEGSDPCEDGIECTTNNCIEGTTPCYTALDHDLCQDGEYCNGVEQCSPVVGCEEGPDPCDDGIDCTIDRCIEDTQSCEVDVDHQVCDDDNDCTIDQCDKTLGCLNPDGTEGPGGSPSCLDGIDNDCDDDIDLDDTNC